MFVYFLNWSLPNIELHECIPIQKLYELFLKPNAPHLLAWVKHHYSQHQHYVTMYKLSYTWPFPFVKPTFDSNIPTPQSEIKKYRKILSLFQEWNFKYRFTNRSHFDYQLNIYLVPNPRSVSERRATELNWAETYRAVRVQSDRW